MSKPTSTYDLAAPQIAPYVRPLTQGSLAPPFEGRDQDGRLLKSADDHLGGKHLVVILMNTVDHGVLSAFAGCQFPPHAAVIGISGNDDVAENVEARAATSFIHPIIGDSTGSIFASYGLHKDRSQKCRIVLVTPSRQVRGWIDNPENPAAALEQIMDYLKLNEPAEEAGWHPPHAPVLVIPNVLSRAECAQLIAQFETGAPFTVRPPRAGEFDGSYVIPVYEHNRQDRVDYIIKEQATLQFLDQRLFERVTPMIQKAFAFDVTNREPLHIARYVGPRGGNKMGHRDNTSAATAHRRFALSMNLNDDFEGGEVVFREYSDRGYRGEPGTALIFSSSLLHEVQETTAGTRYNLISHLFSQPPR